MDDERKDNSSGSGEENMSPLLKSKMESLKERAQMRKNRPDLRHQATPAQIRLFNENCKDLEQHQFNIIIEKK